jgi:hypothetical protein
MDAMNIYWEQPMICPQCGELVIADPEGSMVLLPTHPDRLFPFERCEASRKYFTLSYSR